jgi:hypothetical protein
MASFNSFIHRLLQVPLSQQNYNKELNIIKQIAVNNGYNPNIIDTIISKKNYNRALKLVYPHTKPQADHNFKTITFSGKITQKISKHLSNKKFKLAYKTNNTLAKFIKNNKSKTIKGKKSGVYKLNCQTCPKFYIGQTGRCFEKRINEHKKCFLKNRLESHYAAHLINESHSFNDNFQILHTENKSRKLNFLEFKEINKYKHSGLLLNDQLEVNNSPLLNLFT